VRDVHPTHYGRHVPDRDPEGPNIGLIGSLSSHAQISEHGFITTPYRVVRDGKVTDEIVHLDATQEEEEVIARRTRRWARTARCSATRSSAGRQSGHYVTATGPEVDLMDVSPEQIWSVATAMIPFLEHDDANRALDGLEHAAPGRAAPAHGRPVIGTGMERRAAVDTGDVVLARTDGTIEFVDATKIVVTTPDGRDEYPLQKFMRSNQGTLIHQKPLVPRGPGLEAGDVMADGSATDMGEMASGKNLMVAFMSWEGYNFEDAIILSERLVKDDELTSIHIEEYEIDARTTKLGDEEITRDIPNRSEESLRNLDDRGIVRIGAEVQSGDLLVGKVTPKGETELTAEEKLIRAIFKEKAREVRDTSLKVPARRGRRRHRRQDVLARAGDDLSPGRQRARARVRGQEAQDRRGRQARRPPRQQGRDLEDRADRGHAVPRGRLARRRDPQPARRAEPHEHRPDPRDRTSGGPRRGLVRRRHRGLSGVQGDRRQGLRVARPCSTARSSRTSTTPRAVAEGAHGKIRMDIDESRRPGEKASGKVTLYNGRTGEIFEKQVTVGYMYILKLLHLVDDKIHARSTGPYSLGHPAAAGRQGAVRRPALRRDGGVGARGLRRRVHAAGDADHQVRRHRSGA
jgi:DNA-directed RNA polymerase subunit beta